jgi:hypothetical protein
MDKIEFNSTYSISDAAPRNPAHEILSADGFATAIEEFINEGFGGIAHVDSDVYSGSSVLCCTEYVAYFFKTLLADVYGRVFIEIKINIEKDHIKILIEPSEPLPLKDEEIRNLVRIARNAGFKTLFLDGKFHLKLNFSDAAMRRVYAISPRDGRHVMLYKMGEIFHCGALKFTAKKK